MVIRKATIDDVQELAKFARATFTQAFAANMGSNEVRHHIESNMTDQHFSLMLGDDSFHLARDMNSLIGFAQVGSVNPSYKKHVEGFDGQASELRRLYVAADVQSKGVGSSLISHAIQDPYVIHSNHLYLTTWESNTRAQKLYERHGFRKVGEIPEYNSNRQLTGYEYLMVRQLQEPSG